MIRLVDSIPAQAHITDDRQYDGFESDEKRFEWQMNMRANHILLGDTRSTVTIQAIQLKRPLIKTDVRWTLSGELISGSFMSGAVRNSQIPAEDIDIYFRSQSDADDFMRANPRIHLQSTNKVAYNALSEGKKLNLIFGIKFNDPVDLISHFDMRACSIALDPCTNIVYAVQGAFEDCCMKRIVYNPVPHNTTIARLVKYAKKGFDIDPYQRLFLAELLKGEQYNPNLEISTGYRAVE
jgi:hypothetical protein